MFIQALVLFSRLGVYLPLPGVDVKAFQQSVQTGGGLLGYIDTLSGGSISRVGVFSLGAASSRLSSTPCIEASPHGINKAL